MKQWAWMGVFGLVGSGLLSGCAVEGGALESPTSEEQAGLFAQRERITKRGHGFKPHRPCKHGERVTEVPLVPDATGYIDASSNALGVVGPWYVFADGYGFGGGRDGACQAAGHADSECSVVTTPDPAGLDFPNVGGAMCTAGVVAQVLPLNGELDWGNMGFAASAFNLATTDVVGVFDAAAENVVGVAFDIDQVPPGLRVQVTTPESAASGYAYWGATESFPPSPVVAGKNIVRFSDVQTPSATPLPLDTTRIESIQFVVPGIAESSTPYAFCVSNVRLLVAR